jgi:hypothetical protein
VLCAGGSRTDFNADVIIIYSARSEDIDHELGIAAEPASSADLMWDGSRFPLYGRVATFAGVLETSLTAAGRAVDCRRRLGGRLVHRVGYELFSEVEYLLTSGQPAEHAMTPTLERHIAFLRQSLVDAGAPFVEIPPRPHGYEFICCLTHDIDFCGIRRHAFDHTLAGFVVRASIGTLLDLCRGRRSLREAGRNWGALLSLPFVLTGLMPDFWRPFDDYSQADRGWKSTFFLIPFRGRAGIGADGQVDGTRAVAYQASDVRDEARDAVSRGSELAVHGIDAWRDVEAGREEMSQLTSLTDRASAGVRMHWLYFSSDSPRHLEAAGFDYDSTWGYNDAVGYRAGTSQVFRLAGSQNLMELPLSIMDSALLFSRRMGQSPDQAIERCKSILQNARQFGGTVVVNWHDRSLAPERLWGGVYSKLLDSIADGSVWFATAGDAVEWFRWRRSIRFAEDGSVIACDRSNAGDTFPLPPAVLRVHRPAAGGGATFDEFCLSGGESLAVAV